jgi:hypothetical protein
MSYDSYQLQNKVCKGLIIILFSLLHLKTKEINNKPKYHLWLKNIRPNYKLLENDIRVLKNRQTTKNLERFE